LSAPYKTLLTIDFETRWDSSGYTLRKMTTEEYIRDPRFKAFGACIHEYGTDKITQWYSHEELPRILSTYDWSSTAVLAHNAQFDVSILEWIYDVHPCFIFDSLSMARARNISEGLLVAGNSLATLAEKYGLPAKGKAVHTTDGLTELTPQIEKELAEYCMHDVFLCEEIFKRLVVGYPSKELRLIDMTLKMFTNPVLELDSNMLVDALHSEKESREALLKKLGVEEAALASNKNFEAILKSLGVVAPTKKSKTTGKQTLALAKTDAHFQAMLNGENEDVALLCEARLKVKSTTERTRAQRFLDISRRGPLPVPLSYYGALSGRWTAAKGSAINMQNLKRGSFLRKAIMAPVGHQLVVGDLSQIEPRVLAWLSDYTDMLDIFRAGGDPYAAFGAQMFNIPGLTKESHPDLRQSAKSALLGCGYGLGWASFAAQLLVGFLGAPPVRYDKAFAKQLGVTTQDVNDFIGWEKNMEMMRAIPHTCSEKELLIHCLAAKKIIDKYRDAASPVVDLWDLCNSLVSNSLYQGKPYVYKCLTFDKERILLPSGLALKYPALTGEADVKGRIQWAYGADEKSRRKLYGGKIVENVVQAVARCVMTDGMLRIQKRYSCVLTVHDEVVCLVPEDEAKEAEQWVLEQMIKDPSYMPGIPLDAETGCNKRYGEAK